MEQWVWADADLVRAARQGDKGAFAELVGLEIVRIEDRKPSSTGRPLVGSAARP